MFFIFVHNKLLVRNPHHQGHELHNAVVPVPVRQLQGFEKRLVEALVVRLLPGAVVVHHTRVLPGTQHAIPVRRRDRLSHREHAAPPDVPKGGPEGRRPLGSLEQPVPLRGVHAREDPVERTGGVHALVEDGHRALGPYGPRGGQVVHHGLDAGYRHRPRVVTVDVLHIRDGQPKGVGQLLQHTAPRPGARPPQPPRLLGNRNLPGRPLIPQIHQHVAELVARLVQAPRADQIRLVRPRLPREPAQIRVVHPQHIREFGVPALAVHRPQPGPLENAALGHHVAVVGHAVEQRGAPPRRTQKLFHDASVPGRIAEQIRNGRLVVQALHRRVPKEHLPGNRERRPGRRPGTPVAETRQIPLLIHMVRRQQHEPPAPRSLQEPLARRKLVARDAVHCKTRVQPRILHSESTRKGPRRFCTPVMQKQYLGPHPKPTVNTPTPYNGQSKKEVVSGRGGTAAGFVVW